MEIYIIPTLTDNYSYIIRDNATATTIIIDPSEAKPIIEFLSGKNWSLDYILNTHHHWDHVGGNIELKRLTRCTIIGSIYDKHRIPGIDRTIAKNEEVNLNGIKFKVLFTPGHTTGQVNYWFYTQNSLFTGDTLFSMGCGRIFEGTAEMLFNSLNNIAALPENTKIYPGHEYSLKNAEFALTLEPNNQNLHSRINKVKLLRSKNLPSIPSTIELELKTNPFLRCDNNEIISNLNLSNKDPLTIFTRIRQLKDQFN